MGDAPVMGVESGKSFLDIKEFLAVVVKVATALIGLASLFALLGYTIILSFISDIRLYGLATFPQEFYKEAAVKFFSHMLAVSGKHPISFLLVMFLFVITIVMMSKFEGWLAHVDMRRAARFLSGVGILSVILLTLRIDAVPDNTFGLSDAKEVVLFHISLPVLCVIFCYLAFNFGRFALKPYGHYYLMILFLIGLLLAIPIAYGSNIFDIEVFPVEGIDFGDSPKINSLNDLKDSINEKKKEALFFLMGHTADKEVFFDWKEAMPPAKMLIMDRSLIKYLKVTRESRQSLRILLSNPGEIRLTGSTHVGKLPESIQKAIDKISRGRSL